MRDDRTSPPLDKATAQRMSPPGISYFYGAADVDTALAERRELDGEVATVAQWIMARHSFVVDLARLPEVP